MGNIRRILLLFNLHYPASAAAPADQCKHTALTILTREDDEDEKSESYQAKVKKSKSKNNEADQCKHTALTILTREDDEDRCAVKKVKVIRQK